MKETVEITFPLITSHRHVDGTTGAVRFTQTTEWITIQLECPECNGTEFRQMYCGSATYDETVDTDRDMSWGVRWMQNDPEYVEGSFEPGDEGWWCTGCNAMVDRTLANGLDWYRDLLLMPAEQARTHMLTTMATHASEEKSSE